MLLLSDVQFNGILMAILGISVVVVVFVGVLFLVFLVNIDVTWNLFSPKTNAYIQETEALRRMMKRTKMKILVVNNVHIFASLELKQVIGV